MNFCKLLICLISFLSLSIYAKDQVSLEFFFQPGCKECEYVKSFVLPVLEERFSGKYKLTMRDTGIKENFLRLVELQERFKISSEANVSIAVNDTALICGVKAIEEELPLIMQKEFDSGSIKTLDPDDSKDILRKRGESFTIFTVISAGLVDGINPCAFSTLIFMLSLLAVLKAERRRIILAGISYCTAVYLSYFAMGFGLFRFIKLFSNFKILQMILNTSMIAILLFLAFLSFRDAWRFRKNGNSSDLSLQLSDSMKGKIRGLLRKGLSYRFIIPGAFIAGILVTAIESVCTGQVYVPTLVFLAGESDNSLKWTGLLALYNFMFVLPLLLLFALYLKGTGIQALLKFAKQEVFWAKILMGIFFILLAGLIYML